MRSSCTSRRLRATCAAAGFLCAFWFGATESQAFVLITAQEAALPNAAEELEMRGVTRGPKILVLSPAPDAGVVTSPVDLLLRFETYGGAAVDPLSVKVTYLKMPALNLTQRIGTLITSRGIEVRSAEVPPGTHNIRVEIKDTAGRVGTVVFPLVVADLNR